MPNIQYNTVRLRKQGLSRGRITVKLLELGKAEHLYMFITTAMLIIGVLADSLWAQSVPLCMVQNKLNHQKLNIWMTEVILKQLLRQNPIAA